MSKLLREYIREALTENVYGPVYRATPTPGPEHSGSPRPGRRVTQGKVLYWAPEPRTGAFGKYVTKAMIRLRNPYTGTSTDAYDVVSLLNNQKIINILKDLEDEIEPLEDDEDLQDKLIYVLESMHLDGVWQDPDIVHAIKDAGFDGVISVDPVGGDTEYVTFNSKQYKILDQWVDEDKTGERK